MFNFNNKNNNSNNNDNNAKYEKCGDNKYKYKYMNEFFDCPQVYKTSTYLITKNPQNLLDNEPVRKTKKYIYVDSITKIPVEFHQLTCNEKFMCKRNCRPEIKKKCTLANFWGYENFEYIDMKNLMPDRLNKTYTKEIVRKTKYHNFKCQITLRSPNRLLCKLINRIRCFGLFGNKKIFFSYWDCAEELSLEIFKMVGLDFKIIPELPKLKNGPMVKFAVGIKVKDLWKFSGAMKILHEELQDGRIGFYETEESKDGNENSNENNNRKSSVAYELTKERYINTVETNKKIRNLDQFVIFGYTPYQETADYAVWKYL